MSSHQEINYRMDSTFPASTPNSSNSNNNNDNSAANSQSANTISAISNAIAKCSNNNNNNNNSAEQPQTKRQKIEKLKTNTKSTQLQAAAGVNIAPPPDILDNGNTKALLSSSLSSSAHSISTSSSPTSTPSSSRAASLTQLINVKNITNSLLPASSQCTSQSSNSAVLTNNSIDHKMDGGTSALREFSNSSSSSSACNSAEQSCDEVDRVRLPDLLPQNVNGLNQKLISTATHQLLHQKVTIPQLNNSREHLEDQRNGAQDMREFEESLVKQCLCGVSERMLQKPFQSHYYLDANGKKRVANLSEWPTNKLLQFLSNLQLLFDIYLKQNSKGFICSRIMDVCDALIRNDHNLIDEIIELSGYSNSYVQFLAGRVLAAFLVIAKHDMDDDWLKKLVDNLFNFDRLNHVAVQKIHFSLEIIKRIVEWKDIDLHPLEDEIVGTTTTTPLPGMSEAQHSSQQSNHSSIELVDVGDENHTSYLRFQTQQPSIETNYFALHYRSDDNLAVLENNSAASSSSSSAYLINASSIAENHIEPYDRHRQHLDQHQPVLAAAQDCHIVTLTDSESFDTTHLKCVTIKNLENKWPALVKNMSALIANHLDVENAENCILNFLQLWENIISVKANLSIVETLPFYAQLDKFELLLNQHLSCTIYKQMLCLFNEALCYGSTLALQDMLPDETCMLAHQIVRHVKDFRILESLPRRQPENIVGFIGFKSKPITYNSNFVLQHFSGNNGAVLNEINASDVVEMDKTILQKMVLLVLKSIAVTVKEIRSDSSDSSIDSSDYDAYQDMVLIERSIRDVLRKLESFIKNTLEFHPECHFSKILIHLFDDQDDHLIEAMVCMVDVTAGISFRNNAFPELVAMLNPVYTFLEFLKMISNSSDLLLDLLVSNETCFLLYLLRFLKYIRMNWTMFVQSCHDFGMGASTLDEAMSVLIRLRLQISRLVSRQLYPYDISPVLRLLESCESLYEGNEFS